MKLSKIFRSPFFWIILGLLGLIIVMDFARGADGYEEIPTSEAVSRLESKEPIKSVTLVDNEQLIRIEMPDETKYKAYWVGAQGQELTSALQTRVTENTLEEWSVEVPQPSFWSFILPTLIPFC